MSAEQPETDPDLLIAALNAAGCHFDAGDRARISAAAAARAADRPVELPTDPAIVMTLQTVNLGYRRPEAGELRAEHLRKIIEDRNRSEGRGWDWNWDLCDQGLSVPEQFGWLNTPSIWGLWKQADEERQAQIEAERADSPFWQKVREACVRLQKSVDYHVSAGKLLEEIKVAVQTTAEGDPWGRSWKLFVMTELEKRMWKALSYRYTNKLIEYSHQPEKADRDREASRRWKTNARSAVKKNTSSGVHGNSDNPRPDPVTEVKDIITGDSPLDRIKTAWRQLDAVQKDALVDWIILQIEFSARAERLKNAKAAA